MRRKEDPKDKNNKALKNKADYKAPIPSTVHHGTPGTCFQLQVTCMCQNNIFEGYFFAQKKFNLWPAEDFCTLKSAGRSSFLFSTFSHRWANIFSLPRPSRFCGRVFFWCCRIFHVEFFCEKWICLWFILSRSDQLLLLSPPVDSYLVFYGQTGLPIYFQISWAVTSWKLQMYLLFGLWFFLEYSSSMYQLFLTWWLIWTPY